MKAFILAKTTIKKLRKLNTFNRTLQPLSLQTQKRTFATNDDKNKHNSTQNTAKEALNKAKDTIKEKAQQAGDSLHEKASNIKDQMSQKAQETKQSMQNQASNAQSAGKQMASDFKSNMQQADSQVNYWKTQYEEAKDMPIDKLILCDHTAVRTIYDKFKSEKNLDEAEKWRNQLMYEIARHSIAEEIVVYPLLREKLPDGEKIFQKDIQEQHRIKEILYSAQSSEKNSADFRGKIDEAMQLLFKHIESEENEQLPLLRKCLSEAEMVKAGNQYMRRKFIVPTKPHTAVPEDPPTLNSILGLLTAPLDKFRDLFTKFPDQDKMADIKKQATEHSQTHDKSGSCSDQNKH